MPQIYYCDMTKFEHFYDDIVFCLSEERRRKAERLINKNDALLSATAGLMLEKLVVEPQNKTVEYNEHGKPFFEHGPGFSISHSWRYSVLAVSEGDIGVDIEMRETPKEAVIKRCFTEDEQRFAKESIKNFLRIWSAKEAVLKFLGTGFSPKNFSVLPLDEEKEISGRKIKLFCAEINGIPLTVAYCGNDYDFEIKEFQPEDLLY